MGAHARGGRQAGLGRGPGTPQHHPRLPSPTTQPEGDTRHQPVSRRSLHRRLISASVLSASRYAIATPSRVCLPFAQSLGAPPVSLSLSLSLSSSASFKTAPRAPNKAQARGGPEVDPRWTGERSPSPSPAPRPQGRGTPREQRQQRHTTLAPVRGEPGARPVALSRVMLPSQAEQRQRQADRAGARTPLARARPGSAPRRVLKRPILRRQEARLPPQGPPTGGTAAPRGSRSPPRLPCPSSPSYTPPLPRCTPTTQIRLP
jgi:hypothetical protein